MDNREFRLAILHNIISSQNGVGKTWLQKLGYFLQEKFGVSTKYPFRMHHYGPYSDDLETDVSRLKLAGYVNVQPDTEGYGFHITKSDDPPREWELLIEPFDHSIQEAINCFGNWPISKLELAATIHFIEMLHPDMDSDKVVSRVKSLKPKFEETYIRQVRGELQKST